MLGWLLVAAVAGTGWRHDGTNVFADAASPTDLVWGRTLDWSVPLEAWGNASPLRTGDLVCVTAEPTTLACFGAEDGAPRFTASHDVVDALGPAEAETARARLARADEVASRLEAARRELSALQRDARRSGGDPTLTARLAERSAEVDRLKTELDASAGLRTPPDKEIIGYASATPASDGRRIYALFGNGVVAAHGLDGERAWARWLGPHDTTMRGYHTGATASPVLAGGHLIVPYGTLKALDPATGATVWEGRPYRDYGTPTVATVGGVDVLLLPDGQLIRARDGEVLQTDLGDIWYVGPVVDGADVWYVGGKASGHQQFEAGASVRHLTLEAAGDRVRATLDYAVDLPTKQPVYAPPVLHDGVLHTACAKGDLLAVRAADGAVDHQTDLAGTLRGELFAAPVVAGDRLVVATTSGQIGLLDPSTYDLLGRGMVGTLRATPLFLDRRAYFRDGGGLKALKNGR